MLQHMIVSSVLGRMTGSGKCRKQSYLQWGISYLSANGWKCHYITCWTEHNTYFTNILQPLSSMEKGEGVCLNNWL